MFYLQFFVDTGKYNFDNVIFENKLKLNFVSILNLNGKS